MKPPVIMPELTLDWDLCTKVLTGFIQSEVRRPGFPRVIVGISGGVDSSLAVTLAALAMGPENGWGGSMTYKSLRPQSRRRSPRTSPHPRTSITSDGGTRWPGNG